MRSRRLRLLGQALRGAAVFGLWAVFSSAALAQNPVPLVNLPLVPDAIAPGGPEFTLTVNGTGFLSGAVVDWNGSPLATQFVSRSQLTATVPAADIAIAGTASVTVVNPAPGGGTSNFAFFTVTSPTSSVDFILTSTLTAGPSPGTVAVGDFNRDGKLDLAVGNTASNTVSVFLGDGTGQFTLGSTSVTDEGPFFLMVGDFNGDGILDLVTGNHDAQTVSILLGDGTGNFTLASSTPVDGGPLAVAVGDFNGDGKLDVVTSNDKGSSPGSVSILLGRRHGQAHIDSVSPHSGFLSHLGQGR